jgi:hypothetical protein
MEKGIAIARFPSVRLDIAGTHFMFVEDVASGIVPFNVRSGATNFRAEIRGSSTTTDRALLLLSSLGERGNENVNEVVAGSIGEIARNLSWFGRISYEIVHPREDRSIIFLSQFTPQRLFNLGRYWLQVVPKEDRQTLNRSLNWLPSARVWVISMPKLLGGYWGYRAILRSLHRFDSLGPRFWRNDLERGMAPAPNFDFQEYRRQIELFEARITKRWGWNRRDFSGRNWTEFMLFYRILTFRWAQAVLREHIISELNGLFARLRIKAAVSVSGMPLPHEVPYLRNDMMVGNLSFIRAYEASSI